MPARILLPDGTPASIHLNVWSCPDPAALPVLEYFSNQVDPPVWDDSDHVRAMGVVKVLVGSHFVDSERGRGHFPKGPNIVV